MSDDQKKAPEDEAEVASSETEADAEAEGEGASAAPGLTSWANLWQVPAIVASLVLIGLGFWVGVRPEPEHDFEADFAKVELLLADEEFEAARDYLRQKLEPALEEADPADLARFHALIADWFYAARFVANRANREMAGRVDEQYGIAADHGLVPGARRIEQWGEALLALGDMTKVRQKLDALSALTAAEGGGSDAARRRSRLFRRMVEAAQLQPEVSIDGMLELLAEYRSEPGLRVEDDVWAAGRQAELRLEDDRAGEAIDRLLLDMRRIEAAAATDRLEGFGELYMLLGQCYYELGEFRNAEINLLRAAELVAETDPVRGRVLVTLGRIDLTRAEFNDALGRFDEVVERFVGTRSHLPALLGRAEVRSVLGDHEASLEDYLLLREHLEHEMPRRDLTVELVAASLCDRHDASLAQGNLDRALEYARAAEKLFAPEAVPADVLLRIASTSNQLARNLLLAHAREPSVDDPVKSIDVDPDARYEANRHFKTAGDYFIRHARTISALSSPDQVWADSLWNGAAAYEAGGWYDLAITHDLEYIGGRSTDDPRRAEVTYHLAQAYQAVFEHENAARYYERVIDEHPRSTFASQSHVPLARCYQQLGRDAEAEQQLLQVLAGERFLEPDALDYRDAMIELGAMYHQRGDHLKAIARLDEAMRRYPDDRRATEVLFRLADSHRQYAIDLERQLQQGERLAPSERERLSGLRTEEWGTALAMFEDVSMQYERKTKPLTPLQRDYRRNASLYQGDCAHALGEYERAIALYDHTARTYDRHQSSMQALVRIIDCYERLGDPEQARTAHRRALVRLKQLPDAAFEDPASLMDRGTWEQWLANRPLGGARSASAAPVG